MGRVWETAETRNRAVKAGQLLGRVWETAETRPCHLASAACTAAARADPHAGKAHADEGYRLAQASRQDEV